jgi:putative acetyltransferase
MSSPPAIDPASIRVRPVLRADVPQVVALVRAVLAEFGLRFGDGSKTDGPLLDLPSSYEAQGGAFWVADCGPASDIFGTCGVGPVGPGVFELRKMYLRPATRGAGVGRLLLDTCVAWAREHGGRRLVLDTTDAMDGAIRFYERNGFTRDDAQIRGSRCSRGYAREL